MRWKHICRGVFLILLIYCLILTFYNKRALLVTFPVFHSEEFASHLSSHAKTVVDRNGSAKKLIILAMTDASFDEMAMNLYETSFKRFHIDNYLFLGTGSTSCTRLLQQNIHCLYYTDDPSSNVSDSYGSKNFIRKMNIRTKMIIEALAAGFTVVHTDLDVVFLDNPMPMIEELLPTYDFMILWDQSAYNAGFLVINPTTFTINVYLDIQVRTNKSESLDDQQALNQALGQAISTNQSKFQPLVHTLDQKKYLCGVTYFETVDRNFPPSDPNSNLCPDCLVVHNNWIVSKEAKVYRFKEALMWFVDEDGYYSHPTKKYFSYQNPLIPISSNISEAQKNAIEDLKTAFALSRMLKRTLVLPRFQCGKPEAPYECSLLNHLSIRHLDKFFAGEYRESSFFLHHLIPEDIKVFEPFYRSRYSTNSSQVPQTFTIKTSKNGFLSQLVPNYTTNTEVLDFSSSDIVQEKLLLEKLGKNEKRVIHFSSLMAVKVAFDDKKVSDEFNKDIEGFVTKAYRQF